jgi:hypothetical protein
MAEDRGKRRTRVAVAAGQVGAADPDARDAHEHVARTERGEVDVHEGEGLLGRKGNGSSGLHGQVPFVVDSVKRCGCAAMSAATRIAND